MNDRLSYRLKEIIDMGFCRETSRGITLQLGDNLCATVTTFYGGDVSIMIFFNKKADLYGVDDPYYINLYRDRHLNGDWYPCQVSWPSYGLVSMEIAGNFGKCFHAAHIIAGMLDELLLKG